jgi:predicted TIM-barrel fold metal-dependent hydrolase
LPAISQPIAAPHVDSHAHVFVRGLALATGRRYTPDYDAALEDYLALLRTHGLARGVLVQPSFLGTDNAYLLRVLRACPSALRGVVVVAPGVAQDTLRDMALAGVVGVRLNLMGRETPELDSAPWRALLERIADLGWHVEVHLPASRLHEVIPPLRAAGCPVVVDHFGRPDPATGIADPGFAYLLRQSDSGRVWVKLSGAYRNWREDDAAAAGREATRQLLDAYTAARLVWGSDWPHTEHRHIAYTRVRRWLDEWIEDPVQQRAVLADTPARLFGFQDDARAGSCQVERDAASHS